MSYQLKLLQVLLRPIVSEKSSFLSEKKNQVVFMVSPSSTKQEVKDAVELVFKVNVVGVQILNRKGKQKKFGRSIGRRIETRRAFVSIQAGQEIRFEGGV